MPKPNPLLILEGSNDLHALMHLLRKRGHSLVKMPDDTGQVMAKEVGGGTDEKSGVDGLIAGMEDRIRLAEAPIGFVFDADPHVGVNKRWEAAKNQLMLVDVDVPDMIPESGFIGFSQASMVNVGVWIMPDNTSNAAIESFLLGLVADNNRVLDLACESALKAMELDESFGIQHLEKAKVFTFLAWQPVPGMPYGRAVARNYFRADSHRADPFVAWYERLFGSKTTG